MIRASRVRTRRYDTRTLARKIAVAIDEQRHGGERDQRQPPVEPQHGADDAEQDEEVAEHRHHALREQLVQDRHVLGDARQDLAHRTRVVVGRA